MDWKVSRSSTHGGVGRAHTRQEAGCEKRGRDTENGQDLHWHRASLAGMGPVGEKVERA